MHRFARLLCLPLCLLLSVLACATQATTLTVTSNADSGAGTLRQAIASAATGDTIVFASDMTITLSSGSALTPVSNIAIDATGHNVAVNGNRATRVFMVNIGVIVQLTGLTIEYGSAAQGAGIYNSGILTLTNSTIINNDSGDGGGVSNFGTATLTNSTLSGNSSGVTGGGISNYGNMTLTNCTVSGNSALDRDGGGIFNSPVGTLTMTNCTLSGNTAGGGIANNTGTATVINSIVADGCFGDPTDGGGNLDSGSTCGFGAATSKANATLNLGPLANNGGPTQTMLPGAGSAVIDAGVDAVCTAAPVSGVDQRGISRPQGTHCDSGAVEVTQYGLTVNVTGAGNVSAGSTPAPQGGGILNCTSAGGSACSAFYLGAGSTVTLSATSASQHVTWDGACAAAGNATIATVTMNAAENCTAAFAPNMTTTTLTSSSSTNPYGLAVTLTAAVAPTSPATAIPTGTVTFLDGGSSIGTGTLSGGVATFTTSTLAVGSHAITAQYGGDGNFLASAPQPVSNTQTQTVTQAAQTITFVSIPPGISVVTDTYTVYATGGASGNPVTYSIDPNSTAGACAISGYIVFFTGTGNCIIDGNQAGNATYAAAPQATQTIVIGKSPSFVSLYTMINPSTFGQSVTFTANIDYYSDHGPQPVASTQKTNVNQTNTPSLPTPAGTVTFAEGTIVICSSVNVISEAANCPTSSLPVGNHTITATYSGDDNFTSSTNTFVQVVNPSPTAVSAPTLDRWATVLLGSLLGASVFWRLRRADRAINRPCA